MNTKRHSTAVWAAIAEQLAAWCAESQGRKAALVAAFQAQETAARNNIEEWIHPDAEKRVHPRYGAGATLIECAEKLGAVINLGATAPTTRKTRSTNRHGN